MDSGLVQTSRNTEAPFRSLRIDGPGVDCRSPFVHLEDSSWGLLRGTQCEFLEMRGTYEDPKHVHVYIQTAPSTATRSACKVYIIT